MFLFWAVVIVAIVVVMVAVALDRLQIRSAVITVMVVALGAVTIDPPFVLVSDVSASGIETQWELALKPRTPNDVSRVRELFDHNKGNFVSTKLVGLAINHATNSGKGVCWR